MVNQPQNNSHGPGDADLAHINVERLSLTLGVNAILRDISFTVECGSLTGIVGPNGAGKSSLLRAIYCHRYDQPASLSGQVMIAGHPVHKMNRRERACKIAVVLQESALPFEVSVREVLATGLTPRKPLLSFTSRDDTQLIERIAADLDVMRFIDRDFGSLSGGEKQRVLIARALVQQPQILLLDEPTNHLDIQHQIETLSLVRSLGVTVLLTIHDLNMAGAYCDQLLVLNKGQLVANGKPDQVLNRELIQDVFRVSADVAIVRNTHTQERRIRIAYDMPSRVPVAAQPSREFRK
ncbi:MAG: ABC transporter ATP-binding protein [Thalassolituus sp.]|uniref:ABC transporter ATP-binding protein n=1 Tax=unclassified Thalassolituus TaxID=2624967 RepID=UPI00263B9F2E|nr:MULTISPECIES: ABC transporter ATP-binding protein [unclassified Thalassolituus]MDQ4424841.1 ABC transporter ATP-binding protein [Thalassolituus sp.]MDQ4426701.1 ABC transporter ATP-binding protein [Thalassolituus sp.]